MEMDSTALIFMFFLILYPIHIIKAQDYEDNGEKVAAPPPEQDNCSGIFLSYEFTSRQKVYPFVKNATAQAWPFKCTATVLNAGKYELKAWKIFIGFQYGEILVSASGAVLIDGNDFPAPVGNGTYLSGYPQTDLKTSIETAGDYNQIQAQIEMTGTQFGVKPSGIPMPKTIRLSNDGYMCPTPTRLKSAEQNGDLLFSYDVIQAYDGNYLAQVTMENSNPLGRLDHWNLTWEWMRGEFIYTMRGAYAHNIDYTECIYGAAGDYNKSFDFSQVMNCQKKPVIADLPPERAKDTKTGNLPQCCKNGTLLPTIMDGSKSMAVFQLQVYKIPPDVNRTALYPPERWKIVRVLNPDYKCGPPIRLDPTEFPDPSGLPAMSTAVASWQVVCNITRPKDRNSRCCVPFSAYYNESDIPCDTCACGCDETKTCNPKAPAMLLPSEALLVTFSNRTEKAEAWAKIKHYHIPKLLPCSDNCGVSINWHINSDYKQGWTARINLFNWEEINFENWFAAVQMKRAYRGFEKIYSFNGTYYKSSTTPSSSKACQAQIT